MGVRSPTNDSGVIPRIPSARAQPGPSRRSARCGAAEMMLLGGISPEGSEGVVAGVDPVENAVLPRRHADPVGGNRVDARSFGVCIRCGRDSEALPPLCTGPTGVVQTHPRIHPPVVHIPVHRVRPHPSKSARSCGFRLWRSVDTCGPSNDTRVIHQPVHRRRPQGCGRGVSGLIPPSTGAEVVHSTGGSPQSCPHRWTMWKKARVPVEGSNRDSRVGQRVAQAPRCFRLISLVSSVTWL